jgi:hypothetical protein
MLLILQMLPNFGICLLTHVIYVVRIDVSVVLLSDMQNILLYVYLCFCLYVIFFSYLRAPSVCMSLRCWTS